MLYGYLYSASHRRLFIGVLGVTGRRKEVFKLRRDAGDIPYSITLRIAGGVSFQSAGPTTAKARFWDREVRYRGTVLASGRFIGFSYKIASWIQRKYSFRNSGSGQSYAQHFRDAAFLTK